MVGKTELIRHVIEDELEKSYYHHYLNPIKFTWKDCKREPAILDFETLRERIESEMPRIVRKIKVASFTSLDDAIVHKAC